MTDDIDPYDPGSSDKLWKNPFSSSNPLDAMLNFGNPGNSNDWKNDQSSSDFVTGRDRLEPYNDEPEIIKYKKRTVIRPLKETIIIEEESIEDINNRQYLLKQRLENLINSRYSERSIPRKSKSTFGSIISKILFLIFSAIFILIFLIFFFSYCQLVSHF